MFFMVSLSPESKWWDSILIQAKITPISFPIHSLIIFHSML
jgi:hypothetical protein